MNREEQIMLDAAMAKALEEDEAIIDANWDSSGDDDDALDDIEQLLRMCGISIIP